VSDSLFNGDPLDEQDCHVNPRRSLDGFSEWKIVSRVADKASSRVVKRVIRTMQQITDGIQSGEDSGLINAWDEYCVQVQWQESVLWELYCTTLEGIVYSELPMLAPHEKEEIWLQTASGIDWRFEDEDKREADPVFEPDIVAYILSEVEGAAADWTNPRIRNYLDGGDLG